MLKGTFDAVSLPGILQLLSAEGRTGRLDVAGRPGRSACRGSIWLAAGRIVHAEFEATMSGGRVTRRAGEESLHDLMLSESGTFGFEVTDAPPPQSTISGSTEQLLMEAACRRDDALRSPGRPILPVAVPAFAPVPEGRSTPRFNTLQWRILATVDGRKDVAALAKELGIPVPMVSTLLSDLVGAGVIELT